MSETVVDGLEVVEVQEEHGDRVGAAVASVHGVGEPVEKQGAVGQAGERVVEGLVVELLFEGAAVGDIAAVEHDGADVGLIEEVGHDGVDGAPLAVGVGYAVFEASTLAPSPPVRTLVNWAWSGEQVVGMDEFARADAR